MLTPTDYLRIVVDPLRLAILGRAAVGPVDVDALAEAVRRPRRRVLQEIGTLRAAGLLTETLELDTELLGSIARSLASAEGADPAVLAGPWTAEEAEILARFFEGSRLTAIPSAGAKRLLVLERLVQEFEPGVRYTEREVSSVLQMFHPDYASLRRYLVDHAFLTRADGLYWRSGGRYAVGDSPV